MNDPEIEDLLRSTRAANDSEDIQLRVLTRFAELDADQRSQGSVFGWKGIALTGWLVAGIAVLAATLQPSNPPLNPMVTSQEKPVVPVDSSETTPEALTFENDADEPVRVQKHPWSSTVILLSNVPTDHQMTFPVGGRFNESLP